MDLCKSDRSPSKKSACLGLSTPCRFWYTVDCRYLKTMLSRFDDRQTALAAYNMGPTRLKERGNRLYRMTKRYVHEVLRRMDQIRSSDQVPYHPVLEYRLSEYRLSLDHHNIAPLRACLAL